MLLVVASCYVPYVLAHLFIQTFPVAWLARTIELKPNPWAIVVLWVVILCNAIVIVGITTLAVRTLMRHVTTIRFYLVTVISFLLVFILSYIAIVVTNITLNMGWSVL
jgi:hypothetical protein